MRTTKKKITEHTYLLTRDFEILDIYDDDGRSKECLFGIFLFSLETTKQSGENLRTMLQASVDSTKKLIDMIDAHETK